MKFNSFWYIASPYTDPEAWVRLRRYEDVMKFTADCMRIGLPVFSPIVHSHILTAKYSLPYTVDFWEDVNNSMIRPSEGLLVLLLDGWNRSKGVGAEIEYAHSLGKPIVHHDPIHPFNPRRLEDARL